MCSARANVCYGPKADICDAKANVRYEPIADIRDFDWVIVKIYAQFSRSRIDLPITQSLSSSDKNDNSSVKWVTRCL